MVCRECRVPCESLLQHVKGCPGCLGCSSMLVQLLRSETRVFGGTELADVTKKVCQNEYLVVPLVYGQSISILFLNKVLMNEFMT